MKNEIKVGDAVMVVTQHGKSEVCHALEKGSVATVVDIHESGVVVQGASVATGNDINQFLGHDEVMRLAPQDVTDELDKCHHYFVDTMMFRDIKTITGYTWNVSQTCRKCEEERHIVVHKLGWGYYDEEELQCGR